MNHIKIWICSGFIKSYCKSYFRHKKTTVKVSIWAVLWRSTSYCMCCRIIIPIILTIWTYNPLWELEQEAKEEGVEIDNSEDDQSSILFLGILVIWALILGRMLYLLKKRAYTLRTKF